MAKRRIPVWAYFLAALLLIGGAWLGWPRQQNANVAKSAAPPAVPVTVASVTKADFPVYLTGLGTVLGFNTVTVRTRVDGEINRDWPSRKARW